MPLYSTPQGSSSSSRFPVQQQDRLVRTRHAENKVAYDAAYREHGLQHKVSMWSSCSTVSSTLSSDNDSLASAAAARQPSYYDRPLPSLPAKHPAHPARRSQVVPQSRYAPHTVIPVSFKRHPPVRFRVDGRGAINLGNAARGDFAGLERRDEPAFHKMAHPTMSFRLEWFAPSGARYPPYTHPIAIREVAMRESVTMSRLARTIAREMQRFIEVYQAYPFPDPEWKVGPGFIGLDQIDLVELHHVSEGSVQAVLKVKR